MAKEIRVIAWCDGNHDEDEKVQADGTVTVAFGRGKPRTVDLCNPCNKELIEPVQVLFGTYGVVADGSIETGLAGIETRKQRKTKPNVPCPECGFQSVSRNALSSHLKGQHGKGMRDYPGL